MPINWVTLDSVVPAGAHAFPDVSGQRDLGMPCGTRDTRPSHGGGGGGGCDSDAADDDDDGTMGPYARPF